jgi:hypothetical protein
LKRLKKLKKLKGVEGEKGEKGKGNRRKFPDSPFEGGRGMLKLEK